MFVKKSYQKKFQIFFVKPKDEQHVILFKIKTFMILKSYAFEWKVKPHLTSEYSFILWK